MKKLLLTLCILLLLPTHAFAIQIETSDDINKNWYEVGTQFDAGTYTASYVASSDLPTVFAVVSNDYSTSTTYDVDSFSDRTVTFTISEGESLMMCMGTALFTPLNTAEVAAIDAADPLKNTIDGVDLAVAFKKAEELASDTANYPMLKSLSYSYFEQFNCFNLTIFMHDEATDDETKAYADDFIRLLNKCCMYQNLSIAPATPTSLGGIYDNFDCSTIACRWSDFPDENKFIIDDYIPAGTHGFSTLDMREVMK